MARLVLAALLALALSAGCASQRLNSPDQNTWAAMARVKPDCTNAYQNNVGKLLDAKGNTTCKDLVFSALNTVKNQAGAVCPDTKSGSDTWKCMINWDGTKTDGAYVSAWRNFVVNCEILYIANRVNTGESEDGFVWSDNSCFQRFNDMATFVGYLSNPPPSPDSVGSGGGSAGTASVNALMLLGASLLAALALLLG